MQVKEFKNLHLQDFDRLAQSALDILQANGAHILALKGDLGAGKTLLAQNIGKIFNIDKMTSPTFVIMNEYEISGDTFKKMSHIDAYRLENEKELRAFDLDTLLQDPQTLTIIEWPERFSKTLKKHRAVWVYIQNCQKDNARDVVINME